ncbi:MAG: hypothetical protein R6U03_08070 [Gillisia sp.]
MVELTKKRLTGLPNISVGEYRYFGGFRIILEPEDGYKTPTMEQFYAKGTVSS